jgi:hypothetical protein
LEALAVLCAFKENHSLLSNNHVEVQTDHLPLKFTKTLKLAYNNRLTRCVLSLQPYNFTFVHKKGIQNIVPDVLSRIDWTTVEANETNAEKEETTATIASVEIAGERVNIEFDMNSDSPFICPLAATTQLHISFVFLTYLIYAQHYRHV